MNSTKSAHTWISVIIGLIAVAIVMFFMPKANYQPAGLILPAQKTMPASKPADINFYSGAPATAQNLGSVRVTMHYSPEDQKAAQKAVMNKVRELAASVGANAVVVKIFGHTLPNVTPAAQAMYQFRGEAVFIPNKQFVFVPRSIA